MMRCRRVGVVIDYHITTLYTKAADTSLHFFPCLSQFLHLPPSPVRCRVHDPNRTHPSESHTYTTTARLFQAHNSLSKPLCQILPLPKPNTGRLKRPKTSSGRCSQTECGLMLDDQGIIMVSVETENDALEGRSTSCGLWGSRRRWGWIRVELD